MNAKVFHPFVSKYMIKYMYDTSGFKDPLKYRSVLRNEMIKNSGLRGIVENHHIIPKQWRNHNTLKKLNFDVNSSYNIVILPNLKYHFCASKLEAVHMLIHSNGHKNYNRYVGVQLDELIDKCSEDEDKLKYNFWLFYIYLKDSIDNNSSSIPWN